jgi:hypothetical protein
MFNLVIKMEEGKIYDIVWDNGCFDCDENCKKEIVSESVFNSSITQTYENCYEKDICVPSDGVSNCDPKFYITWFGTDKDKRQLKTAGLAMTKFKHYSVSSLYSSIKGLFN